MIPTYADIPDSLKNQAQWVCWRAEPRGPKVTKIPINARTGAPASVTHPADWCTYDEAVEAARSRGLSGIGLVLTEECGLVGVDLDDAIAPGGEVQPWAARIVLPLASYTERSPSGRGLRVFVRGKLPGTKRRKGKVELYDRARFLTVTGNRLAELEGRPLPANVETRQVEVEGIHREVFPEDHAPKEIPKPAGPALEASDAEIIDKARSARNGAGERFAQLWAGDWQGAGFPSQSEGDAFLLGSLRFWTGGDKARALRLFGQSGLMREKWNRADYREKTWATVDHGDVYRPPAPRSPPAPVRTAPAGESPSNPIMQEDAALTVEDILDRVRGNQEPAQPFPVDALPPGLRELVERASAALGVDPAFIALPALAGAGAAIGNSRRVLAKIGWEIAPVLWTVVVAPSGALKTPSLEAALCGLHRQEQKEFFRYEQERVKYEARKKELERQRKAGAPEEDLPEEPQPVRYVVRDTTLEKLAVLLADNPRGLLLEKDELAAWLGGFDRYSGGSGGEVAQWLEFHHAGKVTVDRKTGDKKLIHIPFAFVSITGTIQPEILRRLLGPRNFENGLAARFFLAMPDSRPRRWTEEVLPEEIRADAADLFGRLLALQLNFGRDGEIAPVLVPLREDAKKVWVNYYDQHNLDAAELGDGRLNSAWSKLEGTVLRFALIHATVREVLNPTGAPPAVDLEAVQAGIRLVEYGKQEIRRVYAMLAESDADTHLRRLVQFFQEHPNQAYTARELAKGPPYMKMDRSRDLLALLVSAGFLKVEECAAKGSKGGRRCVRFQLSAEAATQSGRAGKNATRSPENPNPRLPETAGETGNRGTGQPGESGEEFREEL